LYRREWRTGELSDKPVSSSSDEGDGDDRGDGVPDRASVAMTLTNGVALMDWARRGRWRSPASPG
jgi:hypothetical protein